MLTDPCYAITHCKIFKLCIKKQIFQRQKAHLVVCGKEGGVCAGARTMPLVLVLTAVEPSVYTEKPPICLQKQTSKQNRDVERTEQHEE